MRVGSRRGLPGGAAHFGIVARGARSVPKWTSAGDRRSGHRRKTAPVPWTPAQGTSPLRILSFSLRGKDGFLREIQSGPERRKRYHLRRSGPDCVASLGIIPYCPFMRSPCANSPPYLNLMQDSGTQERIHRPGSMAYSIRFIPVYARTSFPFLTNSTSAHVVPEVSSCAYSHSTGTI